MDTVEYLGKIYSRLDGGNWYAPNGMRCHDLDSTLETLWLPQREERRRIFQLEMEERKRLEQEKEDEKLWVGVLDSIPVVFDPDFSEQIREAIIPLWDSSKNRMIFVPRERAKMASRPTPQARAEAVACYRAAAVPKHYIKSIGSRVSYQGVQESKKHRETHCYDCGVGLTSNFNPECNACGWLLCNCGACGCQYTGL